ncbi:hypothetical protein CBR_g47114 [Chara braunii]|uniref:DUF4283 domain-containing protein n=1 Tax=Chara braunii TaxID=69332 RepID=A0A388M1N2_CHABU|nr:hypothetical protein CBR_g47114 [Chara braunii]|eukprot:GBG88415.1 hypothetical protein CBR_g47114 [Chara braunii]
MVRNIGATPAESRNGEVVVDEKGKRFKVNEPLDAIKEKRLKERTVIFIFQDEAKNLSRGVKEDMVRVFEDGWFARRLFNLGVRRGRIKFEGPNVVSYVAKAVEVANWLVQKGSTTLSLKGKEYPVAFKPWMTKSELKELKLKEAKTNFWIMTLRVPLDAMYYLPSAVDGLIGGVKHMHAPEADKSRPKLMNIKLDMDPQARFRVEDTLAIESPKGELWRVEVATPFSDWCRKCGCRREKERLEDYQREGTGRERAQGGVATQLSQSSRSRVGMGSELLGDELMAVGIKRLYEERSGSSTDNFGASLRHNAAGLGTRGRNTAQAEGGIGSRSRRYDGQLLMERRIVPLVRSKARDGIFFLGRVDTEGRQHLPSEITEKTPTPLEVVARAKRLFGNAFPMRLVPRSTMANVVIALHDKVYKYYFLIMDARVDPSIVGALSEAGIRWFLLDAVREQNSQELDVIAITSEVSALLLLSLNEKLLEKENLHSNFLASALVEPWRMSSQSAQSQSSRGSSMIRSPAMAQG